MAKLKGCGLGLRRDFIQEISLNNFKPDFWEVTPENWMNMPYYYRETFEEIMASNKIVAHGLSLSIGGDTKPSIKFLKKMKLFLDKYNIKEYSEHISYSSYLSKQSYELLPLPMTSKMIDLLCDRIKFVEDILQRELILENPTYYYKINSEMNEIDFMNILIDKSKVKILLDVNNIYVNSINHNFDPKKFIDELDTTTVSYIHLAGHYYDKELDFLVDSHGMNIKNEVWELYRYTLKKFKAPTMIERDSNIPPIEELIKEYEKLKNIFESIE